VARRAGERLIAAWVPEGFHQAVTGLAEAAGLSKSEVLRRSLENTAMRLAKEGHERERTDT